MELKIIEARRTGNSFDSMTEKEFDVALTGVIFNISVICGCQLPTHPAHINALEKEFMIFLKEFGYGGLTSEEILTAFRMNANGQLEEHIKIYGAIFNIDFASKVLSQYINKRFSIEYKLLNIFEKSEADKKFEEEAGLRRKKLIEQFEKFLQDENAELDLENCYMQLCEDGAFLDNRIYKRFLANPEPSFEIRKEDEFKKIGDILKEYPSSMEDMFQAQSKAVVYLFVNMKKTNRLKLYDEKMTLINKGFSM